MKMLSVGAALATVLAMGAPVAASAATAHNIVLVPGAFADKSSWDKVAHILRGKGFKVTEVAIPMTSLEDDVTATQAVLARQKGPTVLVGHSWGGAGNPMRNCLRFGPRAAHGSKKWSSPCRSSALASPLK